MSTPLSVWLISVISGLREEIYDSSLWAVTLGVSPQMINDWIDGRGVPSADQLDSMLTVLEKGYPTKASKQLAAFADIAARPITETAPGLTCEARTLDEYRTSALHDLLRISLSPLPAADQREILKNAAAAANEKVLSRSLSGE